MLGPATITTTDTRRTGGASTFFHRFDQGLDLGFKTADLIDRIRFGPRPEPAPVIIREESRQSGLSLSPGLILAGVLSAGAVAYLANRKK